MTEKNSGRKAMEEQLSDIMRRSRMESGEPDPFPKPRIEAIARSVYHDLEILDASLIDIKERTRFEKDVLLGIKRNNAFIAEKIIPLVVPLMARAQRAMFVDDANLVGYSSPNLEHEPIKERTDNHIVTLIVFDNFDNKYLRSDEDIQIAWDTSNLNARESLSIFSRNSFQDILGKFKGIVEMYTVGDDIN